MTAAAPKSHPPCGQRKFYPSSKAAKLSARCDDLAYRCQWCGAWHVRRKLRRAKKVAA